MSGLEKTCFGRLRVRVDEVRQRDLKGKRFPYGGNVATLECYTLGVDVPIAVEATSRNAGPAPLPMPRSKGGYFEPSVAPGRVSQEPRLMNTDSEYKALSELAARLDAAGRNSEVGTVYLFSEREPCESCRGVIDQFEERFPKLTVVVEFEHSYP